MVLCLADHGAPGDLKSKVVVLITGAPEQISSALAAHHQTAAERWKSLRQAGAVGIIAIPNPASMEAPWARSALNRLHPSMGLAGAEFNETEGEKLALYFNPAHADKLFPDEREFLSPDPVEISSRFFPSASHAGLALVR